MRHLTAHAVPGTLLFHTWQEARDLWLRLVALGPPHALVLMPDHVHLVAEGVDPTRWHAALSGYALWRHHQRGRAGGRVWAPSPPQREVPDRLHLERTTRYVLLNPCRGRLCTDPLAWPFSTHRDAVGLAVPGVRAATRYPERFHRYVSADPTVNVSGTPLPGGNAHADPASVVAAVSALVRQPVVGWDAPARDLAASVLRDVVKLSYRAVCRWVRISPATLCRLPRADSDVVARVLRVLGDPRFPALDDGDLRGSPAWRCYQQVRAEKRFPETTHVRHTPVFDPPCFETERPPIPPQVKQIPDDAPFRET